MASSYTAKDITVLEGLEPVRKRPGMYIGGVGTAGLHRLVWEILDNAVDEAMNGYASNIQLTLHADGSSVTVTDDGRGVPVDKHPKSGKSALEVIYTTLHAGGKFEHRTYRTAGGLHGVGASVVTALSKELVATSTRDGWQWQQTFKQGTPVSKLRKLGRARGSGTTVLFRPDPTIFPKTEFDAVLIRERLEIASYLHKGIRVVFDDETGKQKEVFQHTKGLVDYLARIVAERRGKPVHDAPFMLAKDHAETRSKIELVLHWTESTDEHLRSYVNGIPTGSGGAHENGTRAGLGKGIRNFIDTHGLTPKGVTLTADDIREGLTGVLSVFIRDPQFQGQTKDRLNNPEMASVLDSTVRPALEHWLNHNISAAEAIVARIILAARAREASRAAQQSVSRKSATSNRLNLPGKLSDCTGAGDTELFIVEGDSAGGSAKQGRDRRRQAILPLRGKVLNVESASLSKVLDNKELSDVVTALGCGLGKNFELGKLRYERIIILADADSDGNHIATLLLTFFYRFLPKLMAHGKVFLAQPPLYRVDIGKETFWALDDAHRDEILSHAKSTNGRSNPEITRFKGLGEMMPKVLWETTLNPDTRRLLRVEISDQILTDRVISDLMGKNASARFRFIMERAEEARALDV